MAELSKTMPAGMSYKIPFNTAPFVKISIEEGHQDAVRGHGAGVPGDAGFLQNIRYTLIPAIVAPIALLGAFATMNWPGFLDQRADHVRHGAGDRHPRRRCHRGGGERRADHGQEGLPPRDARSRR
ncbi:efflux RND transporter permease subunit [Ralstonia solanacearum]|uniref:efflux RND transporter permease subunit n=1 Tax=Ralstonia solanacearum TaxID=305 RepID=UPI00399D5CB5